MSMCEMTIAAGLVIATTAATEVEANLRASEYIPSANSKGKMMNPACSITFTFGPSPNNHSKSPIQYPVKGGWL